MDSKGAVVPGAEVTIANEVTRFSRTVYTNDHGAYQFLGISPDTYSLTINATGFATVRLENIQLMVNMPATIDEALRVQGWLRLLRSGTSHPW